MQVRILSAVMFLAIAAFSFSGCGRSAPTPVETSAPGIVSTYPAPGATEVSTASQIRVVFSEPILPSSVVILVDGVQRGTLTVQDSVATLSLSRRLFAKISYDVVVPGGVRDLAGNSMDSEFAWTFTTGFGPLGESWTAQPSNTSSDLLAVAQGADQFLLAGEAGAILKSNDGHAWTAQVSSITQNLSAVFPIGDRWVLAGSPGALVASEGPDLWTAEALTGVAATLSDLWVGYDAIYMVGVSSAAPGAGVVIRYMAPGSWTSIGLPSPHQPKSICRYQDGWIVVGDSGMICTSPDGLSWTDHSLEPGVGSLTKVRWDGFTRTLIAVGDAVLTSRDGVTWTSQKPLASVQWNDVAFTNLEVAGVRHMLYCIVGQGGSICTSEDLVHWTPRESGVTTDLLSVASGGLPMRFIAAGARGTIILSE